MTPQSSTSTSGKATGWCDWHVGPSETAVLIDVIEQGSGPGITWFACAPCREQRRLVPYGDAD
ncbi:hypothetical protein [Streptomyces sp. NPDC051569]|uniref:hypothetical protein n=1 Tax=Streptomyces sp. NPDC051569 TaxID=3365661 RepID=UPI0037AA48F2